MDEWILKSPRMMMSEYENLLNTGSEVVKELHVIVRVGRIVEAAD